MHLNSCSFEVSDTISELDLKALEDGLAAHTAVQTMPALIFTPLSIVKRDADKTVVAGLYGKTFWNWLYIDSVWVQEDLRKQALGTAMIMAAEDEAQKRGCVGVYLWTQSFDAPDFYPKLGYKEFVVMDDFPIGHQRLGFMKRLAA
ncbi:MAG: GNAT family N-acetyltransferase [Alphaproteobacteria bacterium]|nr:GNAT family N-acetyltransferase [Alphaproteobacteria bacterium]